MSRYSSLRCDSSFPMLLSSLHCQSTQHFRFKRKQHSFLIMSTHIQIWIVMLILIFQCLFSYVNTDPVHRCACICPEPHSLLAFDDMLYYDGMDENEKVSSSLLPNLVQQRLVYLDVNITHKNECNCEQQMLPPLIQQNPSLTRMMKNGRFCQLCQCDLNPHSHAHHVQRLLRNESTTRKHSGSLERKFSSSSVMIKMSDKKKNIHNRNRRAATARPERLWEHGVIPYEIQANFSGMHFILCTLIFHKFQINKLYFT